MIVLMKPTYDQDVIYISSLILYAELFVRWLHTYVNVSLSIQLLFSRLSNIICVYTTPGDVQVVWLTLQPVMCLSCTLSHFEVNRIAVLLFIISSCQI